MQSPNASWNAFVSRIGGVEQVGTNHVEECVSGFVRHDVDAEGEAAKLALLAEVRIEPELAAAVVRVDVRACIDQHLELFRRPPPCQVTSRPAMRSHIASARCSASRHCQVRNPSLLSGQTFASRHARRNRNRSFPCPLACRRDRPRRRALLRFRIVRDVQDRHGAALDVLFYTRFVDQASAALNVRDALPNNFRFDTGSRSAASGQPRMQRGIALGIGDQVERELATELRQRAGQAAARGRRTPRSARRAPFPAWHPENTTRSIAASVIGTERAAPRTRMPAACGAVGSAACSSASASMRPTPRLFVSQVPLEGSEILVLSTIP